MEGVDSSQMIVAYLLFVKTLQDWMPLITIVMALAAIINPWILESFKQKKAKQSPNPTEEAPKIISEKAKKRFNLFSLTLSTLAIGNLIYQLVFCVLFPTSKPNTSTPKLIWLSSTGTCWRIITAAAIGSI